MAALPSAPGQIHRLESSRGRAAIRTRRRLGVAVLAGEGVEDALTTGTLRRPPSPTARNPCESCVSWWGSLGGKEEPGFTREGVMNS